MQQLIRNITQMSQCWHQVTLHWEKPDTWKTWKHWSAWWRQENVEIQSVFLIIEMIHGGYTKHLSIIFQLIKMLPLSGSHGCWGSSTQVSTLSPVSGSSSVWNVRRGCDWFSDSHNAFSRSVVSDRGKWWSLQTNRIEITNLHICHRIFKKRTAPAGTHFWTSSYVTLEWGPRQLFWQHGGGETLSRHRGEHVCVWLKLQTFLQLPLKTKLGTEQVVAENFSQNNLTYSE